MFVSFAGPQHGLGGLQDVLRDSAVGLVGLGHQVSVITARHPDGHDTEVDSDGVEWHFSRHPARVGQRPDLNPAWVRDVETIWSRLHSANPFDALLSESTSIAPLLRSPAIRNTPVVPRFHGSLLGDLGAASKRLARARNIHDARQDLGGSLWALRGFALSRGLTQLRGLLWVSVSHQQVRNTARSLHLREADARVVANGVDTQAFDFRDRLEARAELGMVTDRPLIVSIGRLERDKGVDIAVEAVAQLTQRRRDVSLFIVGDGNRRGMLVERTRALGIDNRVHFVGRAAPREVATWLQACDVFVFPTRRDEANPVIALQALACGAPIVATQSGAVPEVVGSDGAGLIVPPADATALAGALEAVLNDPHAAEAMRAKARQRALAHYTLTGMVQGLERVLTEAVADERTPSRARVAR